MPSIDYKLDLDSGGFASGIGSALGSLKGLAGAAAAPLAAIGAAVGGAVIAYKGLSLAVSQTMGAIGAAANRETLQTTFVPLLGSVDSAKSRMAELARFAISTPFELPGVARASATLETITRGALSTNKGLTLVGDVASATNTPFEEMAVTIGRLYSGLESGRPIGESAQRLQELGALSPDVRTKLEKLQAEGKKGSEVWNVAAADMARFSGGMKLQSSTWNGLLSNLKGAWEEVQSSFGTPIMDSLKPILSEAVDIVAGIAEKAKKIGEAIGFGIRFLVEAFKQDAIWDLAKIGLQIAFAESVNFMWRQINGVAAAFGAYISQSIKTALMWFEILSDPSFWTGFYNTFSNVIASSITGVGEILLRTISSLIKDTLKPVALIVGLVNRTSLPLASLDAIAPKVEEGIKSLKAIRIGTWDDGKIAMSNLMTSHGNDIAQRYSDHNSAIFDAYKNGAGSTNDAIDTKDMYSRLTVASDPIFAAMQQQDEDRKKANAQVISKSKPASEEDAPAKYRVKWETFGAGSMAKVGGGGYGRALASAEAIPSKQLAEAQKQTRLLNQIAGKTLSAVYV